MIESIVNYIYNVLVGNLPNTEKSLFNIGGDIIYDPDGDHFDILAENGFKYRVTVRRLDH